LAVPILIGRREVVATRIKRMHLPMKLDKNVFLVDPESDARYRDYWTQYHELMERRGVSESVARMKLRTNPSVIGALMVRRGDADAVICGVIGQFLEHKTHIENIIGLRPGVETLAAMPALITNKGPLFLCDTHINPNPSVSQVVDMTMLAVAEIRRFGIEPRVAMLSHSNFGTHNEDSACKMREAVVLLRKRDSKLEVDGEMHADTALSEEVRRIVMPNSRLTDNANLLVFPTVESANITYNAVKIMAEGTAVGPFLLGVAKPAHVVTSAVTVRGLVNMAALATVGAQAYEQSPEGILAKQPNLL
jgi:malate dehydrogenase (oxaloacetate-decarboxylating)(NADP+)